jgi:tripartite-type tricarboxylate transporter receptor subunit TctC
MGHFGWILVLVASGVLWAGFAPAQEANYPTKPITLIVPYGPGGIVDVGARIFVDSFSRELKVPVIIANRPGGSGIVGAQAMLNASPNGYTLLATAGASIISAVQLSKELPFDPRKDMAPIAYIADAPVAMSISKNTPINSFAEFLQYGLANPGKLRGGTAGIGSEPDIMLRGLLKNTKIQSKVVPYPAVGPLVTAIMGGHLDWMTLSFPATRAYQKSGDVKIVLLTRRSSDLPGVPSGPDVGYPDVSVSTWMGLLAGAKTPKPIIDRLVAAAAAASKDREVAKKLSDAGFSIDFKGPDALSKIIANQWDIFAEVLKEADMKPE